ncbi:HAMP domain-containing sensor histidine kinase [Arenibaculum sp.]|jgi:two-component system sensor histidine kinase ChvG|uniref:sensor histidine kinase n=1 Tax=Arenibaculum sp. TaxID=2865862 RepID=UPI002E0D7FE7|nr:HAMP domain-containing sensor histidine kinase [Arenibaculum sp.]
MPSGRVRAGARWVLRSLASRLVLVSVVFIAVPLLIYQQLREADAQKQALLLESAMQQGLLIARGLEPALARADTMALPRLGEELDRFSDGTTRLKLLLRPSGVPGAQGFFYVGAAPKESNVNLDIERRRLIEQGVLGRLAESCTGNMPLAIRVPTATGGTELLTSVTPVNTPFGCWALVTSHTTPWYLGSSIGQPYWHTPEIQAAALIYLAMAALVLLLFLGVWNSLRRFGNLARRMGSGEGRGGSFAGQNTVPELKSVAEDFDRLVDMMRSSADNLRRAAEDNAHALKTPIAVIRQSLEPLKRTVPSTDPRGRRALDMIERSAERLDGLVSFARRMDEAAADLLEPPRRKVDLSELVERMLNGYTTLLVERHLNLRMTVGPGVVVRASEELLETVVENVVENAISFSPGNGAVTVRLARAGGRAVLTVEDEGPGVDAANLERIFERYFSQRDTPEMPSLPAAMRSAPGVVAVAPALAQPAPAVQEPHFGIGLWIVRRNIEAVGGNVTARNRDVGGLAIRIELPLA